jgi:hypothetical protein
VSLRLWRAPQPYFKLRFCSLIAFGPDCSHFPSAIPNMRETAPTSSAPSAKPAGPKPTSTSTPCPTPLRSPRSALGSAAAAATGSASRPGHTARRRACQTIARNARRRADQRARQQPSGRNLLTTAAPKALAGIRQPERIYNKLGAGGFPLAPWPKPASDWRERAGRKAPTPAHKRAITKTLFGLIIATFRVWLAPPELSRPSSAPTRRARKHPAPWPAITPPSRRS